MINLEFVVQKGWHNLESVRLCNFNSFDGIAIREKNTEWEYYRLQPQSLPQKNTQKKQNKYSQYDEEKNKP